MTFFVLQFLYIEQIICMMNEFHIITAFPKTVTIVTPICIELQEQLLKEREQPTQSQSLPLKVVSKYGCKPLVEGTWTQARVDRDADGVSALAHPQRPQCQ
jgi:hypothetical protein